MKAVDDALADLKARATTDDERQMVDDTKEAWAMDRSWGKAAGEFA